MENNGKGAYQIEQLGCSPDKCSCHLLNSKHHSKEAFWLLRDTRSGEVVDVDEDRNALVSIRNTLNAAVEANQEYLDKVFLRKGKQSWRIEFSEVT